MRCGLLSVKILDGTGTGCICVSYGSVRYRYSEVVRVRRRSVEDVWKAYSGRRIVRIFGVCFFKKIRYILLVRRPVE